MCTRDGQARCGNCDGLAAQGLGRSTRGPRQAAGWLGLTCCCVGQLQADQGGGLHLIFCEEVLPKHGAQKFCSYV
eukprot:SAG31_NODE_5872_length_2280_cov_84.549289_2_plen_75_part_00